jgi:hypothetical protein
MSSFFSSERPHPADQDQVRFTFGKYRGVPVCSPSVPAGYLRWLVKADFVYGNIKEAVYRRLGLPLPVVVKPKFRPAPGEETEAYR